MKTRPVSDGKGGHYGVRFDCPGCKEPHVVPTAATHESGKAWGFNGDFERPTLTPSILVHPRGVFAMGAIVQTPRCHSFVRDGRIEFCSDSEHALARQTVDLPDVTLYSGET